MATALGAYAALAAVKLRLAFEHDAADTDRDNLLQSLCDQANGDLESFMARSVCPLPTFIGTTSSNAAVGATSIVLTSATGLHVGDPILIGDVAGTREHTFVTGISTNTVTLQAPLVHAYTAPVAVERLVLLNQLDALRGKNLYNNEPGYGYFRRLMGFSVPFGITSLTSLEILPTTDGDYEVVPIGDWLLRPEISDRDPGWPATEIAVRYIPGITSTSSLYFPGRDLARARGAFGWPAIPDELKGIAETLVVSRWQMRSSGGSYSTSIPGDSRIAISPDSIGPFNYNRLVSYRAQPQMRVVGG
jgi:hypothetical protein